MVYYSCFVNMQCFPSIALRIGPFRCIPERVDYFLYKTFEGEKELHKQGSFARIRALCRDEHPGDDRHFVLHSRGYLFRCAGTGFARTGGAQHRHTGVQPDERHRPDARRGRGNAVHDRAGAERSETGGQRIHARGGARTAARTAVPARRTVLLQNRSRACSARTRRRSA